MNPLFKNDADAHLDADRERWYWPLLVLMCVGILLIFLGVYRFDKQKVVYKTAPEDEVRVGEVVLTIGLTNGHVKIRSAIDMPAMPDHDSMNRAMGIALNTIANYQTELRKSIYMQPSLPLKTNETEKLQKALKEITELLKAP